MRKHVCVGVLVLCIIASVAVLPVAVVKLADDVRTLVTLDLRVMGVDAR